MDVDNEFIFHQPHNHHHLDSFLSVKLEDDSDDLEGELDKISFSLYDTDPFDEEIQREVQKDPDPLWPTDPSYDQGITPGYKDKYQPMLPGQGMILGTQNMVEDDHLGNPHKIIVSVNPEKNLDERTYSNNKVESNYNFPEWSSESFCDQTKGCGDYPASSEPYDPICERYLCWYCNSTEADNDPDEKGSNHPMCNKLPSDAC
jgi:hypothetical protein